MKEILGANPCIWQLRELAQADVLAESAPEIEGTDPVNASVQTMPRLLHCGRTACHVALYMTSTVHESYEQCAVVRANQPQNHWSNPLH